MRTLKYSKSSENNVWFTYGAGSHKNDHAEQVVTATQEEVGTSFETWAVRREHD